MAASKLKLRFDDLMGSLAAKAKALKGATPFPHTLNIETTNYCNLKCPMCPRTTQMTRPVAHMSFDVFKKIIDQAARYEVRMVWLHMFGEPLMTPGIFDMIRYARQQPSLRKVALSTNVTVLNEKTARNVLDSGLHHIMLSIDAFSEDVYKVVRGFDFQKVLENARTFLRLHRETTSPVTVEISIINMRMKEEELEAFKKEWAEFASDKVQILVKRLTNFGGQVDLVQLGETNDRHEGKKRVPCDKLWKSLTITSAGDVVACCYDVNATMSYGNLATKGLKEIWDGAEIQKLRERHLARDYTDLPLCADCDATFGG